VVHDTSARAPVPGAATTLSVIAGGACLVAYILSILVRMMSGEASDPPVASVCGHEWVWLTGMVISFTAMFALPRLPRLSAALLACSAIAGWLALMPEVEPFLGLYLVWAVPAVLMLIAAGITWRSVRRWRSGGDYA
jgi:hypothetical protein